MKNTDVCLIYPKWNNSNPSEVVVKISMPFACLFIGSVLEDSGYKVKIFDLRFTQNLDNAIKEILNCDPRVVGISVTSLQIKEALYVSKKLREENPNIIIVWGGVHPTISPSQVLSNPFVDVVVRGEGEITFLELVNAIFEKEKIAEIKGLSFKDNGNIKHNQDRPFADINKLPILWNLIDITKYIVEGYTSFISSRGCPHDCKFCYNNFYNHRQWRSLNSHRVLKEIKFLKDRFNLKKVKFCDDNFFVDKNRVASICQGLIDGDCHLEWTADCRIDYVARYDRDFISLLRDAGCKALLFGAESGADRMLAFMNKGMTTQQSIDSAKICNEFDILPFYSFIIGYLQETREELIKTLDIIKKLKEANNNAICFTHIFTPYPGSDAYEQSINLGWAPPQSLEEWAQYDLEREQINYPWLQDNINYELLLFLLNIYSASPKIVEWLMKIRMKYGWSYPYEIKLLKKLVAGYIKIKHKYFRAMPKV